MKFLIPITMSLALITSLTFSAEKKPGADTAVQAVKKAPADSVLQTVAPQPAASPESLLTITITTEPAGASVIFDDSSKGVSPVTISGIDTGSHVIELKKVGCYLKKVTLPLNASSLREYSFTLLQPGKLFVMSAPEGASVYLDAKETGVTPCTINAIKPGDHTIKIEKPDFTVVERMLSIQSGKSDTLTVKLGTKTAVTSAAAQTGNRATSNKVNLIVVSSIFGIFVIALLFIEMAAQR